MLNRRRKFALFPSVGMVLILAACGAPAAPAATATSPPPTSPPPTITATAGVPKGFYPEVPRVSLEVAKAAFDDGSAVFVDVRHESTYDLGHIPGAINIFFGDVDERMGELEREAWIITYCV